MELRYLGFDELQSTRGYRFDLCVRGETNRQFVVRVDLALFRKFGVGIQEGPSLCARKLASDLTNSFPGTHELTSDDLRAFSEERAAEDARRRLARGGFRRPRPADPQA